MKSRNRKRRDPGELLEAFKRSCPAPDNKTKDGAVGAYKDIGDRLKRVRGNLSQTKFSSMLSIKQAQYNRYETGKVRPPVHILERILQLTGVSMDWILVGKEGQANTGSFERRSLCRHILAKDIARKLRFLRARNTQASIASWLGITLRAYQYLEHAERLPSVHILATIAAAYGVSIDWLLSGKDRPGVRV